MGGQSRISIRGAPGRRAGGQGCDSENGEINICRVSDRPVSITSGAQERNSSQPLPFNGPKCPDLLLQLPAACRKSLRRPFGGSGCDGPSFMPNSTILGVFMSAFSRVGYLSQYQYLGLHGFARWWLQVLGLRMGSVLRHLWRFSRGSLLFGKQLVLGFLKCSGKLCSPPAVVVELAFCEF